jgi:hypothetical protein
VYGTFKIIMSFIFGAWDTETGAIYVLNFVIGYTWDTFLPER